MSVTLFALIMSLVALLYSAYLSFSVLRAPKGSEKMQEISEHIHKGAMAFLNQEYKIMLVFMVVVAAILYYTLPEGAVLAIAGAPIIVPATAAAPTAPRCMNLRRSLKIFSEGDSEGIVGFVSSVIVCTLFFLLECVRSIDQFSAYAVSNHETFVVTTVQVVEISLLTQ